MIEVANPIGWCTDTVNVVSGCLNNCAYCYARKMAYRLKGRYGYPADEPFRPTFHPDKLSDIYQLPGRGKRIFLDSMGDLFSPGVKPRWVDQILSAVAKSTEHTFLVLTKRPDRINLKNFPNNLWIGTSITRQEDLWRLEHLRLSVPARRFVSFEPLHGPIEADLTGIGWVIIGAESGSRKGKIVPKREWILKLTEDAKRAGIPVYQKGNIWPAISSWQKWDWVQEFPEEMKP